MMEIFQGEMMTCFDKEAILSGIEALGAGEEFRAHQEALKGATPSATGNLFTMIQGEVFLLVAWSPDAPDAMIGVVVEGSVVARINEQDDENVKMERAKDLVQAIMSLLTRQSKSGSSIIVGDGERLKAKSKVTLGECMPVHPWKSGMDQHFGDN